MQAAAAAGPRPWRAAGGVGGVQQVCNGCAAHLVCSTLVTVASPGGQGHGVAASCWYRERAKPVAAEANICRSETLRRAPLPRAYRVWWQLCRTRLRKHDQVICCGSGTCWPQSRCVLRRSAAATPAVVARLQPRRLISVIHEPVANSEHHRALRPADAGSRIRLVTRAGRVRFAGRRCPSQGSSPAVYRCSMGGQAGVLTEVLHRPEPASRPVL